MQLINYTYEGGLAGRGDYRDATIREQMPSFIIKWFKTSKTQ
jgi:hypothetical protein